MHISLRSDYPDYKFQFDKGTNLQADGKKYPIVYAEGMPLGEFIQTNKDGKLDVVFPVSAECVLCQQHDDLPIPPELGIRSCIAVRHGHLPPVRSSQNFCDSGS